MTDTKRIDLDANGEVDDVAISDVTMFRMERMSDGDFWLAISRKGQPDIAFFLSSASKIRATVAQKWDGEA